MFNHFGKFMVLFFDGNYWVVYSYDDTFAEATEHKVEVLEKHSDNPSAKAMISVVIDD